ncbi:hypothetical protein AURDEDRAFT_114821 [Auricularia subglabra TFB-10046 SS5]|nr:hypothetical protein AURDEDRAFT_114821 [Auricularia subglabra TFB-10046 SS5]
MTPQDTPPSILAPLGAVVGAVQSARRHLGKFRCVPTLLDVASDQPLDRFAQDSGCAIAYGYPPKPSSLETRFSTDIILLHHHLLPPHHPYLLDHCTVLHDSPLVLLALSAARIPNAPRKAPPPPTSFSDGRRTPLRFCSLLAGQLSPPLATWCAA